jgi:serine/threonine protein kinase
MDKPTGKPDLNKLDPGSPVDPTPFGRYLLLGMIARGGMAEVYRAKEREPGTPTSIGPSGALYAVKGMRPQLAREARFVDMFVREGKLAMMLQHPNIVRTVEIDRVEQHHFIAMEYIGGKDLTQVLRRCQEANQRIPVPHACFIAARMCAGLQFAHTLSDAEGRPLNIVNRDVSPSNVRISYDGDVKLLDFGIAQAMLKITSEIGVLKGKFSYMSPEQIRGMPVDARTDVFSTGIILHEMLTTEKLFRSDTEFALMEKVRKAEVPPPSKFNRRVPEALDRIVLRALARDLPDRYQTAAEFGADLDEFVSQYKLKSTEMQELVRGLFRSDYQKEAEDVAACRAATVDRDLELSIDQDGAHESRDGTPAHGTGIPTEPARPALHSSSTADLPRGARPEAGSGSPNPPAGQPAGTPSRAEPPANASSGTLWSRLRGRFTK